jgi:glycosyltransferase involved in cell wall biosynthesis
MESEDETPRLARESGARVIPHERILFFDAARNRGIAAATHPWIFVLDADEIATRELASTLQAIVKDSGNIQGYWIPRMNVWHGQRVPHVSGFPNYQLRCFRRDGARYPEHLHCVVEVSGQTAFLPVREREWIEHDSLIDIGESVVKSDGYAEREAIWRKSQGGEFGGPMTLLWVPLSAFRFRFNTKAGYRDGIRGLIHSILYAFYRFEVEAKVWEQGGASSGWDADVARLRSVSRIIWALGKEGLRRLWRRRLNGGTPG